MQNAGEEGESNLPLIAVQYSAYGARQGEKVILDFVTATADIFLTPPSLRTPPLYFAVQNAGEEGESNPPLIAVRCPAYGAQQGEKVIQRTFFPSQRKPLLH